MVNWGLGPARGPPRLHAIQETHLRCPLAVWSAGIESWQQTRDTIFLIAAWAWKRGRGKLARCYMTAA